MLLPLLRLLLYYSMFGTIWHCISAELGLLGLRGLRELRELQRMPCEGSGTLNQTSKDHATVWASRALSVMLF